MNAVSVSSNNPLAKQGGIGFARPHQWDLPAPRAEAGLRDIVHGLLDARLWIRLGWEDVRQRYRRSLLGPFWLTLSMGLMVGTLGLVYAKLFGMDLHDYLPYLALGLIIWSLIGTTLNEGAVCFIASEGLIRQIRIPLTVHVLRNITRNVIILGHNATILVVVAFVFAIVPGWTGLLVIPGLALLLVNLYWLNILLGALSTRFRDIPPLIGSVLQMVFFVTPIMWSPATLKGRAMVVEFNPVYYLVEIVRDPLLGRAPSPEVWFIVIGITAVVSVVSFAFFARFRERIAYWL
jgi:ABC-type polysaccharide/polyol phosphate export permease